MKKLFTLLMAMVITTMVFGQNEKQLYRLDQPVQGSQDRTGWIGGQDDYRYYTMLNEGEKFAMRLPAAGELPAGDLTVTKVSFGWQSSGGDNTFDPNFRILIYAGGNGDWINLETSSTTINRTMDTTVQGTLLYSQIYSAPSNGWQMVELTTPVQLPANQEIWIAVQALGNSCTWVAVDEDEAHPEWWGQHVNFYYRNLENPTPDNPAGYCWWTPTWANEAETAYITGKYALKVLIDNGEAYVNVNDWRVDMYSLDTYEDQEDITFLYIDEFMMEDSLYLAPALWNMGPDSNNSNGMVRMYIEGTELYFINTTLDSLAADINVGPSSGWIFSNMGGLLAFSDMENYGLSFPFNVCFSFEPYGQDPNLNNNIACAEITDIDLGIPTTTNTLNVFPNPANTYINVENAAGSQISVYNIAGQEVLSVESAEANETINVSNLNAGLYIVRVVNGNEVSTAKVSIIR